MYLEQVLTPKRDDFLKYLIGSLLIFVASFIGQLPFVFAIAVKTVSEGESFPATTDEVMGFLEPNLSLFLMLLSFAFALPVIFLVVKYLHKQSIVSLTTGRKKVDWGRIFFSFGIWTIFTIVTTAMAYYAAPEDFVINFKPVPFAILAVIVIIMVPIQTSVEEYVFRGYLMQGFAMLARNRWFPLVLTSLIFGLMHIANPEVEKMGYLIMIYYIGTGLFLGVLTLMDDGMELALGFHAANNLIGALLITSDWTAFQTHSILKDMSEPEVGFDVLLPIFIIYPILLIIFSKKYKWTNWKEKLTGKIEPQPITTEQNDHSQL